MSTSGEALTANLLPFADDDADDDDDDKERASGSVSSPGNRGTSEAKLEAEAEMSPAQEEAKSAREEAKSA